MRPKNQFKVIRHQVEILFLLEADLSLRRIYLAIQDFEIDIYTYSDSGNRFSGKFYLDICIRKLYFYENFACSNSIVLQPIIRNDV